MQAISMSDTVVFMSDGLEQKIDEIVDGLCLLEGVPSTQSIHLQAVYQSRSARYVPES